MSTPTTTRRPRAPVASVTATEQARSAHHRTHGRYLVTERLNRDILVHRSYTRKQPMAVESTARFSLDFIKAPLFASMHPTFWLRLLWSSSVPPLVPVAPLAFLIRVWNTQYRLTRTL